MSDRIHICSPRRNRIVRAASMLMAVLLVVGTPAAFPSMSAGALTENEINQKLDKLKKREIESNLLTIRETLELDESVKLIPFSAEKGEGKQELLDLILSKL